MKKNFTKFNMPVIFFLCFFWTLSSNAQNQIALPGIISQLTLNEEGQIKCELHANDEVALQHHQSLGASATVDKKGNKKKNKQAGGATIIVDYYNFDPNFADIAAARDAFQSAVDIWAQNIDSDEPIYVAAVFQPLGEGVLGSAGPTFINANEPGLQRDTWYGNALADKLTGQDLNPDAYDIVANFSTVFTNWYFGIDGNTPAEDFDFRSVVFHELCHGLGFFGSMYVDNATGIGDWGFGIPSPVYPAIYDRFTFDQPGQPLIRRYDNFSSELGEVLLGDPLLFRGNNTLKATGGTGASIFTILDLGDNEIPGITNVWLPGSSYSHLDYLTYVGTENGLMVPFLSRGVAFDDPGSIVKAIFDDMGWNGKIRKPFEENARLAIAGEDLQEESTVKLYPNHVHDRFTLDLGSQQAGLSAIKMVDLLGQTYQLIYSNSTPGQVEVDLSSAHMKSGIYILQLNFDNQKTQTLRISKIR